VAEWAASLLLEHGGTLNDTMRVLAEHGPTRVLCHDGVGRSPSRLTPAQEAEFACRFVVFVRNDGWTLGCSGDTEHDGFNMWRHEWVAFVVRGSFGDAPRPISEYSGSKPA